LLSANREGTPERTWKTIPPEHATLVWQTRRDEARTSLIRRETEVMSDEWVAMRGAQRKERNSLVLLQVNHRSMERHRFDT
jgi:hypothetical protein